LRENLNKIFLVQPETFFVEDCTVKDISHDIFQCVGIIIHEKKFIYINALPYYDDEKIDDKFKTNYSMPLIPCDGGPAYWRILFNVQELNFTNLECNGRA
jgi:hypothetical protein